MTRLKLIGLLPFTLTVLGGCNLMSSPESTVKSMVEAVHDGDLEKLAKHSNYAELPADAQQKLSTTVGLTSVGSKEKGGLASVEVSCARSGSGDSEVANCTNKITFKDGTNDAGSAKVVKIGGDWKVKLN